MIPGKRGKMKQVNISLYEDQIASLDEIAKFHEISRSMLLRSAIDLLVKGFKNKDLEVVKTDD
jgi:hypothetical protein